MNISSCKPWRNSACVLLLWLAFSSSAFCKSQVSQIGDILTLSNQHISTSFNLATGQWLARHADGRVFAEALRCEFDGSGKASTMQGPRKTTHSTFQDSYGQGRRVEIMHTGAKPFVLLLTMYDEQPFFLVRVRVPQAKGMKVREAILPEGKFFIGTNVREVCALVNYWSGEWYSEIHPVDLCDARNHWETYSHFYFCGYNRADESSVILGALYSEGAMKIEAAVEPSRDPRAIFLKTRCSYEKNPLTVTREIWESPPVIVCAPQAVLAGLETYGAVARAYRPVPLNAPPPTGWCSWDAGASSSQKELFANVDAMKRQRLDEYGLRIVQLDDGWQQGERCSGHWRPRLDRFPAGMKGVADYIRAQGFEPGLWIGPFGEDSGQARQKDLLPNGKPGGYDLSSAAFKEYLANEMKLYVSDWGFHYIKADFLSYGSTGSREVPYDVSYREAIRIMTDALAPHHGYLMTCINHEWLSVGWTDGQRLGNDVHGGDLTGLYVSLKNWPRRYFSNRNFWNGDPDMLHVNLPTDEQSRVWASFVALGGGATMSGDSIPKLASSRLEILKKALPAQGLTARPCDLFRRPEGWSGKFPRIWNCRVGKPGVGEWNVVGLFNWSTDLKRDRSDWRGAPQNVQVDFARDLQFQPSQRCLVYDFWQQEYLGAVQNSLAVGLLPASCRVLVMRPELKYPQVLGTDRHIVSGTEDLREVSWDQSSLTLQGQTETVKNIPYRVAIHVPAGLALASALADGAPTPYQVFSNFWARVDLQTGAEGKVRWSLHFKKASTPLEPTASSLLTRVNVPKLNPSETEIALSQLTPLWTDQRHDIEGGPIGNGVRSNLGTTAPFWICWDISEYATTHPRLVADCSSTGEGKILFEVLGDGKRLHATDVLGKAGTGRIEVPVAGVKELTIVCHYVDGWFSAVRGLVQNPRLVK